MVTLSLLILGYSDLALPGLHEEHITNYRVTHRTNEILVRGVCKADENGVVAWKPNGVRDEALAQEVKAMLESQNLMYSAQFKFNKKNRILIVQTTTTVDLTKSYGPRQEAYQTWTTEPWGKEIKESWNSARIYSQMKERWRGDDPLVTTSLYIGSFEKTTKAFPFRHQFLDSISDYQVIPARMGPFSAGGNDYRITEISDTSKSGKPTGTTTVQIRPVKINDPNTVIHVKPANGKGVEYAGTTLKGEPFGWDEYKRRLADWQKAIQRMKPNQEQPKPQIGYLQNVIVDPYEGNYGGSSQAAIDVKLGKIRTFYVQIFHRRAVSLDNIRLDPK